MSDDPQFKVSWPEGVELKIDRKHLFEMRKALEIQFKYIIYNQPGFNKFHSLGKTSFYQHFKTSDGIDFGVCNLYWDKDADDKIDYADKDGNIISKQVGGWCVRWLTKQEFDNMPEEDSVISPEGKRKIEDAFEEKLKQAALANLERFQKEQKEKQELMELGDKPPKFLN
tara:strand:+ start:8342 stop:8851 length:510 start_codon:yes stop_codon:yes gene_type:complete